MNLRRWLRCKLDFRLLTHSNNCLFFIIDRILSQILPKKLIEFNRLNLLVLIKSPFNSLLRSCYRSSVLSSLSTIRFLIAQYAFQNKLSLPRELRHRRGGDLVNCSNIVLRLVLKLQIIGEFCLF